MTQKLYYFWDLIEPAWNFIKLYGTFHGQVKKWKIVNYLQRKEDGNSRTNLERMMAYNIIGIHDRDFCKKYVDLLEGLKKITDEGISLDCEKIIAQEIHRQKCDNIAHVYTLLFFIKNSVTDDDFFNACMLTDAGAEGIMCDIDNIYTLTL